MDEKSALRPSEDQANRSAADSSTSAVGMSKQISRGWRPIRNVLSRRESSMTGTGERVAERKVRREGARLHRRAYMALVCAPHAVAGGGNVLLPDWKTDSLLLVYHRGHITEQTTGTARVCPEM